MTSRETVERARIYGIRRIFFSLDFLLPIFIVLGVRWLKLISLSKENGMKFVEASTPVAGTLIGIVLTGVAIIVALSDKDFLNFINNENKIYSRLLFIFEYNVFLAIITTTLGITYQTDIFTDIVLYVYIFLFFYLCTSIMRLVSLIITYGIKKADYHGIKNTDFSKIDPDIPDRLLQDEDRDKD